MKYLLDTHVLIWCADKRNSKLSANVEKIILDPKNIICISSASLWEIAIKVSLGKLTLSLAELLGAIEKTGFKVLHTESVYLQKLIDLPQIHKDPFDRLLVATAQVEDMMLLTLDENIQKYDVQWMW